MTQGLSLSFSLFLSPPLSFSRSHLISALSHSLPPSQPTPRSSPGILHEGFEIFGHAVMKKPNFLFNVSRDEKTGELTMLRFYACLGKLTPLSKKPLFSYLLYTRRMDSISEAGARALVDADRATGKFDLDGVVYTNRSTWGECGY